MSMAIGLGLGLSYGQGGGAAAVTPTTWNPADKGASFALSNGNLTVTRAAGGGAESLRGTLSRTGKRYFEIVVTASGSDASPAIANTTASLSAYLGVDTNGVCLYGANGQVLYNGGVLLATGSPIAIGEVVGFAYNSTAGLLWVYRGGVLQNGDPVAGTGGLSVPGIGAAPFIGLWSGSTATATMRALAASFSGTPPTGFAAWDS